MEIGLDLARPPGVEQKQFQPRFAGARIHPRQFLGHAPAQPQPVGGALDAAPVGRIAVTGIEILTLKARIARFHHRFAEQAIVAGDADALAKTLAGRACRALVAKRAVAQALQSAKYRHSVTVEE